ncbi:MAG: YbaN family protein [Thermoanaerobaculales bacterium]|nr:YbaN family protein [Thermoanaerobaculales bacterium]
MKETIIRILRLTLGWTCVLLGVIGLFVPILQGILLILVGLWLLSRESSWARRWLLKLRIRFPSADRRMRSLQQRLGKYWGAK